MDNNSMNGQMDGNSLWLTGCTLLTYIFSLVTLNHVAMVATILAGLSATAYNIYKMIKNK